MVDNVLEIDRGDAKTWAISYTDENGSPLNLTGWTIALTDVHSKISSYLSVSWSSAAAGTASLVLQAIPTLPVKNYYTFRIVRTPPAGAAYAETSPVMRILPK